MAVALVGKYTAKAGLKVNIQEKQQQPSSMSSSTTGRSICTFAPLTTSHADVPLPRGSFVLHSDGKRTMKLRTRNSRRVTIQEGVPFDADFVREWLEAWEFARVCGTYLGKFANAPHYALTIDSDAKAQLNALRALVEKQLATPQASASGAFTIRRGEPSARILDAPPGPEQITSLVLGSDLYRYIFYTPASRTVQQGAMSPKLVIPEEVHTDAEQYFLVKQGKGWSIVDGQPSALSTTSAFWIYRGQSHAIVSDPDNPLKLFTSYSPAHHPAGRINQNNVDVLEAK